MNRSRPDSLNEVSPDLAGAIRRARADQAEQSEAISGIRSAEISRLEVLHDAVRPLFAQVPQHVDMFDVGVTRGDHPRLFIDMIGFVEIDREGRIYRLVQDSRHGRIVIAESDSTEAVVEHVAAYVAHRLVEREKALAADTTVEAAALRLIAAVPRARSGGVEDLRTERLIEIPVPLRRPRARGRLGIAVRFLLQYVGAVILLLILMGMGFYLYHVVRGWLAADYGFAPE